MLGLRQTPTTVRASDATAHTNQDRGFRVEPRAIRRLESRDISEVARIWNLSIANGESSFGPEPLTSEEAHRLLLDVPARFEAYVYEADGTILGWCALMRFYRRRGLDASAEITACVLPTHRRRGVARSLTSHALKRAPQLGFHTVLLVLRDEPAYLVVWALRRGFTHIGRLTGVLEVGADVCDIALFQKTYPQRVEIND